MMTIGSSCNCIIALCILREQHRLQNYSNDSTTTSGLVRCEAVFYGCGTSPISLFYAIEKVFQLYLGSDVMFEMRRRKPKPTLLQTQRGLCNLPNHIGMVWEELTFDDTAVEIQISTGDGLENRTTDLQIMIPIRIMIPIKIRIPIRLGFPFS